MTDSARSVRVALFTGNYNHVADGVSRTLNRIVGHLERLSVPALVFGPTVASPQVQHEGEFVTVPSIPLFGRSEYRVSLAMPPAVRRRLADFGPTLVHVATPDLLGLQARSWATRRGIPLVGTYHTHFSSYLSYYRLSLVENALWWYLRTFYRPFQGIYVPTDSMADVLRAHRIDHHLKTWPRGVDTTQFNPKRRSEAWRREKGFRPNDVVVAIVSRLVWEKGLDVFAEAVGALTISHPHTRALVVGDGPIRDDLGSRLPGAVFTGHLEAEQLAVAYASADVFLFPSHTETFGNVTLEAMASGLPVVGADAPGSKSLIRVGKTGLLCEPGAVSAFRDATASLIENQDRRSAMGAEARRTALAYDWNELLDRMLSYYEEVVAARKEKVLPLTSAPL